MAGGLVRLQSRFSRTRHQKLRLSHRADFQEPAIEKVRLSHRVGFVGQDMPVLVMVRVCLTAAVLCDRLVCARHV